MQFAVTDHFKGVGPGEDHALPGVFFFYDLSPIKVSIFICSSQLKFSFCSSLVIKNFLLH